MFTQYFAQFFDAKGEYAGHKLIIGAKKKKTFNFGKGSYNIDLEKCSEIDRTIIPFILKRREMIYNTEFSNPYTLNKKENISPPIDPVNYRVQLESNLMERLNNLAKSKFKLDLKVVLIGLAVIVVGYLVATGKLNF